MHLSVDEYTSMLQVRTVMRRSTDTMVRMNEAHYPPVRAPRPQRSIDGTAYWEYGDPQGYPVIMVHGFRGDHHGLEGIARELHAYRVIVPDLPGFGLSPRRPAPHELTEFSRWLREFSGNVVADRYALVGHSFGSLVVGQAVHDGLTPDQLILMNPISAPALEGPRAVLTRLAIGYYQAGARLPESLANRLLKDPRIVRVMSETMAKSRDRLLRAWIHEQHAEYFSTFTDRQSLLQAFRASVTATVRSFVHSFQMPTLVLAGEVDDITPLTEQLKFARRVEASEFHVILGSGHLIHYEAPVECAQRIDAFIQARSQ